MTDSPILLKISQGVAEISLNRPNALNSFTKNMHIAFRDALNSVEDDETARCLVITGNGRGFCAGQDLSEGSAQENNELLDLGETLGEYYNPLFKRLYNFHIPTIAAVNGVAAGAGCSLALVCDIAVVARSATFIQAFSKIGLVPDCGSTWFLPRTIGRAKALGMALTAEPMSADEAEQRGLIWKVVDDENLTLEVRETATKLALGPTTGLNHIRKIMAAAQDNGLEEQLDLEREYQRKMGLTEDFQEGVAAFLGKRQPSFKGK